MSYESENILPNSIRLSQVVDVVLLLGYKKINDGLKVPGRVGAFYWYDEDDYRSFVGITLDIYQRAGDAIKVTTRTSASRSYWDLVQQNRTIKMLRDLFNGHFRTDAGNNRCWRAQGLPPMPLSEGCYLARWRFHNGIGRAHVYLMSRTFAGANARNASTGFHFANEYNPRLISNNLLLPFMIAVWEEYFRATFTACLKYSSQREVTLKRARLGHNDLEEIAVGSQPMERIVAESFSFQRPSSIAENFRLLDQKLDLAAAMRKPYRRRKISLFDSIERLVEGRNAFVHAGEMNIAFFDEQLKIALSDMEVALNRAYEYIAIHYRFTPRHDY